MPGLFHKKSKSSLSSRVKAHAEELGMPPPHTRKLSMGSTSSQSSTDSTESTSSSPPRPCGPLSSHPPLSINKSPYLDEASYREEEFREAHFLQHLDSPSSRSLSSGGGYFQREGAGIRRMTYVYDRSTQWPLKDWQTVPPGLTGYRYGSDSDGDVPPTTALRPRPANHQRRPTTDRGVSEAGSPSAAAARRGSAWKRRGMVFQPDSDGEDEVKVYFDMHQ